MSNLAENEIDAIKSLAFSYFPDIRFTEDTTTLETQDKGEVFYKKDQILPYLQTIFFEEHLLEIQVDQTTRIFFAHITDDIPDLIEEEEDGEIVILEPDYEAGSYLKSYTNFLLTPLTPGIGNAQVRNSKRLVIRFFTGTIAIELGCTFCEQTTIREIPVLRLNYPLIGRVNRNFRSFRIKAVPNIEAKICIRRMNDNAVSELLYQIVDVSAEGLAFQMPADHPPFQVNQALNFTITVSGIADMEVCGNVRHITKARDKGGLKVVCGVQFDLETRALAADLEKMAAAVQRLHLREIAERTANMDGVNLIR